MLTLLIFEEFWFLTVLIFYFWGGTEDAENRNVQWQSQLTSLRKHILAAQLFPLVKVLLLPPRNWEGKGWGLAVYHDPRFHSWHGHISMAWDRVQNHIHWVGDAIYHLILCHPLLLFAFSLTQHQGLFQWSALHIRWPKYWSFSIRPFNEIQGWFPSGLTAFQWIFSVDFLQDWLIWYPCSPRDSQESSPAPQFKSINSSVLSL